MSELSTFQIIPQDALSRELTLDFQNMIHISILDFFSVCGIIIEPFARARKPAARVGLGR
jgi:hypothetical protein